MAINKKPAPKKKSVSSSLLEGFKSKYAARKDKAQPAPAGKVSTPARKKLSPSEQKARKERNQKIGAANYAKVEAAKKKPSKELIGKKRPETHRNFRIRPEMLERFKGKAETSKGKAKPAPAGKVNKDKPNRRISLPQSTPASKKRVEARREIIKKNPGISRKRIEARLATKEQRGGAATSKSGINTRSATERSQPQVVKPKSATPRTRTPGTTTTSKTGPRPSQPKPTTKPSPKSTTDRRKGTGNIIRCGVRGGRGSKK